MVQNTFLPLRKPWRFKRHWVLILQWFLMNVPIPIRMPVIFENPWTELSDGPSSLKKHIREKIKWFLASYRAVHLRPLEKKVQDRSHPYLSTGMPLVD